MQTTPLTIQSVPNYPDTDFQLREFAHLLAKTHSLGNSRPQKSDLLKNLKIWDLTLRNANAIFKAVPSRDAPVSRAGEWMLDNFYIVKQTLRQIDEDLPVSYLIQLPSLAGTSLKGHSRIFALAHEWIGYSQSQIDLTQTAAFLQYYQQIAPLTIGELWALPIMLRIGILERLVYATAELTGLEMQKNTNQFISPALANDSVVANCFLSLRLLSATDWEIFFEQTSRVEQILRTDPANIYAKMDFETRNSYRSVVEELARHSNFSEELVALAAIDLARVAESQTPGREAHVGFYLRGTGCALLENNLHYRPEFKVCIRRALLATPTLTYLGSIFFFCILFVTGLIAYTALSSGSPLQLLVTGLLGFGLALEAAITFVHWNVTHRIKPQSLPRMDFSEGIPIGNRTMVVVPSLLQSTKEIDHLLQELELYHLSNPDRQLTFTLLTDFGDAPTEHMPGDEQLQIQARLGIENLNKKYPDALPFYLFHRHRQWNPSEGVWMGWERKRGKLADFNHLLLHRNEDDYTELVGDLSILTDVKYAITLDADTSLPRGTANRLIATLAHPLNQAQFSTDGHSVIAGYTVLQPRVAIKPTSANRSLFSQIFTENAGFDLYSFAVSDVYQDLFSEGSYVGKGIYDVKAFERSLAGQVRQNTLLSHDLFEGIYGRAALVTDVVLYEDYPTSYLAYVRRLRRWIRGDWQLLPWLFPLVSTKVGLVPNRLSIINLWKIFDNLRRSLLPPTLLALLTAGWLYLPGSTLVWTLLVLLPAALPIAAQTIEQGKYNRGKLTLNQILKTTQLPIIRWGLAILFLPYESLLMLGAIHTTLARLLFVRKHMLQWTTAANSERAIGLKPNLETLFEMVGGLLMAILLGIATIVFNPTSIWVALPLLTAWLFAPHIAYLISRPIIYTTAPLTETQNKQVRRLARRTWAFFEQFTGPNDHWLPPDHFQEFPNGRVAHYTTPTNIGLFMLSTLSAYDLGYLGISELAIRLQSTFETLGKLEHYRGHLLNWYDSQTLTALPPRYISTVDSGNLAACLMTLRQGCLALSRQNTVPLLDNKQWQGLLTVLDILSEILQKIERNNPETATESFKVELSSIYERVNTIQNLPNEWTITLAWLSDGGWSKVSFHLLELLENHPNLQAESLTELQLYLDLFHHQLQDMQRSIDFFAPWLSRLESPFLITPAGQEFSKSLPIRIPTMGEIPEIYNDIQINLKHFITLLQNNSEPGQNETALIWCQEFNAELGSAQLAATSLLTAFKSLAEQAEIAVSNMDFHFLFNDRRQVFHIGYNAGTEQLDPSYYDLLASEARIASLIAIAKGDVPQSHWQHLGRPMTKINGKQVLLSWSGTMFEYLMPTLFMKNYAGTFLLDSCHAALEAQVSYGQEQKVPWGISESGYYAFDINMNYQYQAFGVPNLGYKRDLPDDLVITPYASLLGLSLQPQTVLENMERMEQMDLLGRFGFYEALDYTKNHLPEGQDYARVQSYMAHHQGMIMLATSNYLLKDVMVQRFHTDKRIRSVELLIQEKVPQNPPLEFPHTDTPADLPEGFHSVDSAPWCVPVDSPIPMVHFLSQGNTSVMITNAGGGYSQWHEFALTRWHADTTLDQWGSWIYVQDRETGATWSTTNQPYGRKCPASGTGFTDEQQDVLFYPHKVEFPRSDYGITLRTGITVSTDGVEIRRVNILNDSDRIRRLKLTSYGEVVLAPQAADLRHQAFNKLFIDSEYLPGENALIFQRRPRSPEDKPVVLIHALIIEAGRKVTGEYENDRAKFLGRSQTPRTPLALQKLNLHQMGIGTDLLEEEQPDGTIDPIFSLAQEVDLKPHAKTRVTFLTLAAASRTEALEKLSHYKSGQSIKLAFDEARSASERELIAQGLNAYALENIQRLLSALLYPVGTLRSAPHLLAQNEKGQSSLWAFGISGDYPILLVRIRAGETPLLDEALQAFVYWRSHHATINLVILNDQDTGYALDLHNTIQRQIQQIGAEDSLNQRNGIFVLRSDQLQPADNLLLQAVAGVILDEKDGTLAEHALRLTIPTTRLPEFIPTLPRTPQTTPPLPIPDDLLIAGMSQNGLGGFSPDGHEYIIHLKLGQHTPQPWVNVIANPQFGFMVSESGSGCTWAENSGENRLTPWRNDPVTDMPGEAVYLRDEESGQVWSPTPMPAGAETTHLIRHGAGYSTFESQSHGLNQTLHMFASNDKPIKIIQIHLKNLREFPRRITVTYYAEWVLGTTRDAQQAQIMPEFDPEKHALLAVNHFNTEFGERVAFLAASKKPHGITADRTEFLGRLGSMSSPAALGRIGLASSINAGLDPCAAIQLHVDLAPGGSEEVYFLLGEGANRAESLKIIEQLQAPGQIDLAWQTLQQHWNDILSTVTVETPDIGMDLMLNRWLLYQTLSCRLWGRTALYQSSGAFEFRDQLQDVLALLHTRPDLMRTQILEAAKHQFEAGDVLHWWNPPSGRGVRTRFSDDLLWLPFVTAEYVAATGDTSILIEKISFLKGDVLRPTEIERYTQFESTNLTFSLYEHCRRSLEKGTTTGLHGLPLMGAGDWNDGMNRIGEHGRGESIWLGWFLHATLTRFSKLAELMMADPAPYLQQADQYSKALEANTWDGEWYLRAFYDDGSRLGSKENMSTVADEWDQECQIDSIAQSWAVLSGAADPLRATLAMESVNKRLVKPVIQMILLFTPPFDKTPRDPGYIKGYMPGVRENGGQYTHAAIWTAWAFARLGQTERANELFRMLNPINHSDTPEKTARYKIEPYVIAADIYSRPPFTGRGGWSWYTGSSGWMYRLGLEAILGISVVSLSKQGLPGQALMINPCIPRAWPGFKVNYRFGTVHYMIEVVQSPTLEGTVDAHIKNNSAKCLQVLLDGNLLPEGLVPLVDDGRPHEVRVLIHCNPSFGQGTSLLPNAVQ
ncbi:MAG: glucoamylase family protein [Chloroflexota bacterium]